MASNGEVNNRPRADDDPQLIENGSFANAVAPATGSRLIIASYNIRYAVGSFLISGSLLRRIGLSLPRRRAALVARHLHRAAAAFTDGQRLPAPDIIALQEADQGTHRAGHHDIARELASALSMHYASAPAATPRDAAPQAKQWYLDFEEHIAPDETGATGIALLSRLPLLQPERVALPWTECAWRPRLAMQATIETGRSQLHLFNVHIDPHASISGQLDQHRALLERAGQLTGPVMLLGDFNTLSKRSCQEMRRLLESEGFTTPFKTGVATWRAGLIRLHTDWIFTRGVSVTRWGVARRLGISDHWPVWVEIDMETAIQQL